MTVKSTISARVIANKPLQKSKSGKYFRMALALDTPVKKVVPGQFIHIRLDSKKHILPRPFTIYDVRDKGRVIEVVYQVVGKGTELMSHLKVSDKVRVLCPLGNGFKIDRKARMSVLVGGGIGSAGIYLLLKEMKAQRIKDIRVFIGARTRDDLCLLPEFQKLNQYIVVTTEDGSSGPKGFITSALDKFLGSHLLPLTFSDIAIYSCGPAGMSQAVRQIAVSKNIPCQLSLEARMACGMGLCRVCVCRTTKGYSTVCEDGPVFSAQDLA